MVNFGTSIAIGDYPVDLHGCSSEVTLEHEFEHTSDRPPGSRGGMFQIPLETLIPEDTDGLLAAEKNISQTRLANGATRLQPITMLTGQAAGALAALAVKEKVQPRQVHPGKVQQVLLKERCALSLARFDDIPRGHRLWEAVEMATTHGWISPGGKTEFKPDEPLTRKNAATIVALRAGLSKGFNTYRAAPRDKATFADVPLYHRNAAEIEAVAKVHAIPACSQNPARFCPDDTLTRSEFFLALTNTLKLSAVAVKDGSQPITRGEAAQVLLTVAGGR